MTEKWCEDRAWSDAWISTRDIGQGGQGVTKAVRNKHSSEVGCAKILSKNCIPERRARFHREATAYDTCDHLLLPKLICSNSHHFGDPSYKLFMVLELLSGPTLREKIVADGPIGLSVAIEMTLRLLDVVGYLHNQGIVHRDIKPDNLLLENGMFDCPKLLDLGMAFSESVTDSMQTEAGEEIGNRFLRLPEQAAGSESKRDLRSDLSFLGGVFFYTLTGSFPYALLDEGGSMPHQRHELRAQLRALAGHCSEHLFAFFDRCFSHSLQDRFSSAAEMGAQLNSIGNMTPTSLGVRVDLASEVGLLLGRKAIQAPLEIEKNCAIIVDIVGAAASAVHNRFESQIVATFANRKFEMSEMRVSVGLVLKSDAAIRFLPEWRVRKVGSEFILDSSTGFSQRVDLAELGIEAKLQESVLAHLLSGIRAVLAQVE